MSLTRWQQRYENWLQQNWLHDDKAHDVAHLRRVWMSATRIMQHSAADPMVVLTACYFHDVVNLPKNHPERHLASTYAAEETRRILQQDFPDFPLELLEGVAHAVQAHSFSARITPLTLVCLGSYFYTPADQSHAHGSTQQSASTSAALRTSVADEQNATSGAVEEVIQDPLPLLAFS